MATFEPFGLDDDFIPETFEVNCPICGKPIEIPLDRNSDIVTCPHCNESIELMSS